MQLLRGPYALGVDALSFLWSALFLGRMQIDEPPGAPRESGGLTAGRTLDPRQRDHPCRAARRRDAQLLQLHLLRAVRALRDAAARTSRPATLGLVLGVASIGTLGGSFVTARIGRRIGVGRTFALGCFLFPAPLILVPLAGGPHWLVLALLFVSEFLSGIGLMMLDIMAGTISAGLVPHATSLARLGRVHGRQLRRPAARHERRRRARRDDRPAADDVDRDRRRARRPALDTAVTDHVAARRSRGGR